MKWSLDQTLDGSALIVTFHGRLDAAAGAASAGALANELRQGPAHIVWDLTEMTGYEVGARIAWQEALSPLRGRILGFEIIGGGPLVRVGAVTLTMALGIEASFLQAGRTLKRRSEPSARRPRSGWGRSQAALRRRAVGDPSAR